MCRDLSCPCSGCIAPEPRATLVGMPGTMLSGRAKNLRVRHAGALMRVVPLSEGRSGQVRCLERVRCGCRIVTPKVGADGCDLERPCRERLRQVRISFVDS